MMLRRSCTWNLKPSGKVMNIDVESRNVTFTYSVGGLRVDWLERHHIILRKVIMSYHCLHCNVALLELLDRVNVIGL